MAQQLLITQLNRTLEIYPLIHISWGHHLRHAYVYTRLLSFFRASQDC